MIAPTLTPKQNLHQATIVAIKLHYPIFNRERDYKKIALSFIEVFQSYQTDNRLSKKMLRKIQKLQNHKPLFEKDKKNNYKVGDRNQGYNTTKFYTEFTKAIYDILTQTQTPNADYKGDVLYIKRDVFNKNKLYEQFLDVRLLNDNIYIINDIKNFTEEPNGRIYSTFQRLPSRIKKLTDTPYEIDISSAGQSLLLTIAYHTQPTKTYKEVISDYQNINFYIMNKGVLRFFYAIFTYSDMDDAKEFYTVPCYGGIQPLLDYNELFNFDYETNYNKIRLNIFVNMYYKEMRQLLKTVYSGYKAYKSNKDKETHPTLLKAYQYVTERLKVTNLNFRT